MPKFEIPQNPTNDPDKSASEIEKKVKEENIPEEQPAEKTAEKIEKPELTISQRIGQAKMEVFLVNSIQKDPQISPEILQQIVNNYEEKYDLTPDQRDVAKNFLKVFGERQEKMNKIQKRYPEAAKMYEAITNRPAKGKINIIREAASIGVQCSDPDDFASFLYPDKTYSELTVAEKNELKSIRGLKPLTEKGISPEFADIIIAQQMGGLFSKNRSVLLHEEQHAINSLLRKASGFPEASKPGEWSVERILEMIWGLEEKDREATIDLFVNKIGGYTYEFMKDEISAFLLSGTSASSIKKYLKEYAYQYPDKIKGAFYEQIDQYSSSKVKRDPLDLFGSKLTPEQKAIENFTYNVSRKFHSNNFFNKKFIEQTIENAFHSIELLEKNNFTLKEALSLLNKEPLENWRLLSEKIVKEQAKKLPAAV